MTNNEYYRCCGCYNWTDKIGSRGTWHSEGANLAVEAPLCPDCTAKLRSDDEDLSADVLWNVADYLNPPEYTAKRRAELRQCIK